MGYMVETEIYKPTSHVRFVTAASLFDGHDVSINIMRRILQASGVEVIHLGHNRSVEEVVNAAIQEDVQGIAMSSYQGGHVEYLKYMYDLLQEKGAGHIKIFGGGGGVIVPSEINELHEYGISKLFSPDDGRELGLQGMINYMVRESDYPTPKQLDQELVALKEKSWRAIGRLITFVEENKINHPADVSATATLEKLHVDAPAIPVLGITGTGGAGKSSLTEGLVRRYLDQFPERTIAIISVDPSKIKTGGAL